MKHRTHRSFLKLSFLFAALSIPATANGQCIFDVVIVHPAGIPLGAFQAEANATPLPNVFPFSSIDFNNLDVFGGNIHAIAQIIVGTSPSFPGQFTFPFDPLDLGLFFGPGPISIDIPYVEFFVTPDGQALDITFGGRIVANSQSTEIADFNLGTITTGVVTIPAGKITFPDGGTNLTPITNVRWLSYVIPAGAETIQLLAEEVLIQNPVFESLECIPTVSEWGIAVMLLLVLTAGTIVIHRRKPVTA